jgi:hypothetical protein
VGGGDFHGNSEGAKARRTEGNGENQGG